MKDPKILIMGQQGHYLGVSPNFEKCVLESTFVIQASVLTSFGFSKKIKSPTCGYGHDSNWKLSKEEVSKKAFKEFIELVLKKAKDVGAHYVLLEIEHNGDYNTGWNVSGTYQSLIIIHGAIPGWEKDLESLKQESEVLEEIT